MNKKQTEAAIKVMQAYVDGEEIEYLDPHGNWIHAYDPGWTFQRITYRIKPKPVEFKVWYHDEKHFAPTAYSCMDENYAKQQGYRLITVREVV